MDDINHRNHSKEAEAPGGDRLTGIPVPLLHRPQLAGKNHQPDDSARDVDQLADYLKGPIHPIRRFSNCFAYIDLAHRTGVVHEGGNKIGTHCNEQ